MDGKYVNILVEKFADDYLRIVQFNIQDTNISAS
jgi:hypothetical protein